jgi:DNA-binding NarL/FixJ family response regulator
MASSWLDSGKVDYTVLFFSSKENMIMARTTKTKPKTKPSLANLTPPPRKKRPESLTSREKEILELIWAGFKNKEIGQRLKISVKTVEAHRANMMKKMRVSNTAQLLKTAIQDGTIKIR